MPSRAAISLFEGASEQRSRRICASLGASFTYPFESVCNTDPRLFGQCKDLGVDQRESDAGDPSSAFPPTKRGIAPILTPRHTDRAIESAPARPCAPSDYPIGPTRTEPTEGKTPKMSKRGVKVVSIEQGDSWTSIKAALRLVKRGMARYVDEHTVQLIDADYRFLSEGRQPVPTEPQRIPAVAARVPISDSGFDGFLRYPQRSQDNGPAYPALVRRGLAQAA